MKNKHLTILFIIALVMVILTFFVTREREARTDTFVRGSYLVQGLNPEKVHRIYMERYGDKIELSRSGGNFLIASKGGYPAKSERVNEIFYAAGGIKCGEKVTSNPENYAQLGVDGGEESTIIRFFGENDSKLIGVIIGKVKENDEKLRTYVRLEGGQDVYLTQEHITFLSCDYGGYISERILSGEKENYREASLVNDAGELQFVKKGDHFSVAAMPEGKKEDPKKVDDFVDKAIKLRIFDILKAEGVSDISFSSTMTLTKDDHSVYRIKLGKRGEKAFAEVTAAFEYRGGEITIAKDESEESLKKKEALLIARDSVEEFNTLHQGWIYEIDDRYLKFFDTTAADFIEDEKSASSSQEKGNAD